MLSSSAEPEKKRPISAGQTFTSHTNYFNMGSDGRLASTNALVNPIRSQALTDAIRARTGAELLLRRKTPKCREDDDRRHVSVQDESYLPIFV